MRELVFAKDALERDRSILGRYHIPELDALSADYLERMTVLVMEYDRLREERVMVERRLDEIERMPFASMAEEEQLRASEVADRLRQRFKEIMRRADELYYESHRLTASYLASRREVLDRFRASLSDGIF